MSKVSCRAKDPTTCRFHGTSTTYTIHDLREQANNAARNGDTSKYYEIKEDIRAREQEEVEMRQASWTETDKQTSAEIFLKHITSAEYKVEEVRPQEYEIANSNNIQNLLDNLEDNEVEIEIRHTVNGYDVIKDAYIPILNITITNSNEKEDLIENVPSNEIPEDYWYGG